jgi:hypothetical protein
MMVGPMSRAIREGRLLFDADTERWEVWNVYNEPEAVHCGESFEKKVGNEFLPCRVEMDSDWYVIFRNTSFYLHPRISYWIRVR